MIERGIDQTSIEHIAKRAGVTTVVNEQPPDADLPDLLERLLPVWGEALANPRLRALTAHLMAAGQSHPQLLRIYKTRYLQPRRERAAAFMRHAQREELLNPAADVDTLIDMMEGAIMYRLLLAPDTIGPAQVSRYLRTLLTQAGFRLSAHDKPPSYRGNLEG